MFLRSLSDSLRISRLGILSPSGLFLYERNVTLSVSENTDIMYSLFDDNKENPVECMLVMEDGVDQTWRKMSFSEIEGFTYEKGHRYKLRAKKTIFANLLTDGSACKYELVEILEDKEITSPELPVEATIKSEADIVYEEQCPIEKYSVSSPIFVDGNGTIYNSEGKERPSYKNCRIYLNNTLDPTVPDWVKLNCQFISAGSVSSSGICIWARYTEVCSIFQFLSTLCRYFNI